ncbi:putative glutaredoxin [Edwardsiella phage pEt-SU]|uniref:Putative glutaredoxin n=1 Tax=Edwardsiella phage pEt-SU TaxID=2562142 RepID=A0A4D6DWT0_9CAUD|nr:thioredoxin domain [Edwardsiella phage pEt-SU]QBZ70817.1 putative glutaredoxin [Edwardsiella phage pEt-SU]
METKVVKIYGKPNCPWCDRAKALAEEKGLEIEYINIVEAGINGEKLSEICGEVVRTVPQIFVDDVFIKGGYEGLVKTLANPDNAPEMATA